MLNESIFTPIRDVKNDDNINNNCRLLMIYKLKCYRNKEMYEQDTVENVRLLSKIHPYVTRRLSSVRNDDILFYRKKLLKF